MTITDDFKRLLGDLFRMENSLDIVARWDIPLSEASRIAAEGKLPTVSMTFPIDGCRMLSTWESIYLASLRYGSDVTAMLRPYENKAAYELLLVRTKR